MSLKKPLYFRNFKVGLVEVTVNESCLQLLCPGVIPMGSWPFFWAGQLE